jgi:hypothetical protein
LMLIIISYIRRSYSRRIDLAFKFIAFHLVGLI